MKRVMALCISTLMLLPTGGAIAQDGPIKYRQGVMNAIGGHAGAIAQIAYGGVDHGAHLAAHANALGALSKMVTTAFEEDAIASDEVDTRAKEAIWEDWNDFKVKADALGTAATEYAAAVRAGDASTLGAKLDSLWDTCKGCHRKFRAKR